MTEAYKLSDMGNFETLLQKGEQDNIIQFPGTHPDVAVDKKDSYSSYTDSIASCNVSDFLPLPHSRTKKAEKITRTHFSKKIIASLNWLAENHTNALDSLPYIQSLLSDLKKYRDDYFSDVFASFLAALYDALIFNDSWINVSKDSFSGIRKLIIELNNNSSLDYEKVDKAINVLDKMGLDTTPY